MLPRKVLKRLKRLRLLQRKRRSQVAPPTLTETQILAWADGFKKRTGKWPSKTLGHFPEAPGETWAAVNKALGYGSRGLPGGTTLAQLLARHRGVPNRKALPRLTEKLILAWADAHHRRTGQWPKQKTGPVVDSGRETWSGIDAALRIGGRGLPRGGSLAALLLIHRKVPHKHALPRLSVKQIRAWAREFRRCHGHWPHVSSGPVESAPRENWRALDNALRQGLRGLPSRLSLARIE